VRNRLEVYRKQTAPLVEFYGVRKLLVDLDGTGQTPDAVFGKLQAVLAGLKQVGHA
jgi:adenylate kinase